MYQYVMRIQICRLVYSRHSTCCVKCKSRDGLLIRYFLNGVVIMSYESKAAVLA